MSRDAIHLVDRGRLTRTQQSYCQTSVLFIQMEATPAKIVDCRNGSRSESLGSTRRRYNAHVTLTFLGFYRDHRASSVDIVLQEPTRPRRR